MKGADAQRFSALWRRCVATPPSPAADAVYEELRRLLDGDDRRFHNLAHIADCLRRFDDVAPLLADPDAVEIALWFHDAVYVAGDPRNEQRSAALFLARSEGARPVFRRRVARLILTTRRSAAPRTNDQKFIDDIDLAGFGASWEEFTRHGDLLREEFAAQSEPEYLAGQARFLGMLRRRPRLFATAYYHERLEARAQANLARTLTMLREKGYGER